MSTTAVQDSNQPVWSFDLFATTKYALKQALSLEVWDEDISSNDLICPLSPVAITDANFTSGVIVTGCPVDDSRAKVFLTLRKLAP